MRVFEHVASLALAGGFWVTCGSGFVQAQAPAANSLSGSWRAGATNREYVLGSWGEDCGAKPQAFRSPGGSSVTIEHTGNVLVIKGRENVRSDACWSKNPAIKKQSATFANNTWVVKCRTPVNHAQEEQGTYTLKVVGPDTLQYQDVSKYNWALKQSRCVVTYTSTQTLTRRNTAAATQAEQAEKTQKPVIAQPLPAPQPAQPPPEPEEKDDPVCTPGAPARLTLRPKRAEIEVGQRTCFRPRLVDKAGCPIKDPSVSWSLSHSKALRGTLVNGCFTAGETAAEAEGEFKIVAAAGALRADALVEVHPVDLSALIAKRMGGGVTGFEEEAPLPAAPKSVTRVATRREPDPPRASPRKLIGIALGVAATALALAALWLSRRKMPAVVPATVPSSVPPPLPGSRAPAAHTRAEVGSSATSSAPPSIAATRVVDVVDSPQKTVIASGAPAAGEAWICPKCRVGYPANQKTCPKDGTALMPYADFARSRKQTEEERKKRCPRCGSVFPSHASFCAEDGTPLVDA
jgi:hypothetical protein